MSNYGIKILNEDGNGCYLNSDIGTMISAGRLTMPSALVDTNKYYGTVNLPASIPVADLSVLITPVKWSGKFYREYAHTTPNYFWLQTKVLDNNYTYYTKNLSTGVMTAHTVGDRTLSNPSKWHYVVSAFPSCYWEILGEANVTDIKIFAATCYCTAKTTTTSGDKISVSPKDEFVYSIGANGVETVDYMILCKKYVY